MTLTVREIEDLAKSVGLRLEPHEPCELDDMEIEYTIVENETGVLVYDSETSTELKRYLHGAYCTEYPEDGMFPLGKTIDIEPS